MHPVERESQSAPARLIKRLGDRLPYINFYRFCQLLEQAEPGSPLLGATSHPGTDPVRFRPWPGMGFPVSELKQVETDDDNPDLPPTVRLSLIHI